MHPCIFSGIDPDKLLAERIRNCRLDRIPISNGILPESLLSPKLRRNNDVNFPNSFVISPTR